jgi:glycine oxidase
MESKPFDILIVGSGLAGSILATQYLLQKKKVSIIDAPHLSLSSKVAAGIWNPVVFKRLTKSYLADELIPYLNGFYTDAEHLFGEKFTRNIGITKFLTAQNDIDFWIKKANSELSDYLDPMPIQGDFQAPFITDTKAYAKVKQTGVLDTASFMLSLQYYMQGQNNYLTETFDHAQLIIEKGLVHYKQYSAKQIVFCEGYLVKDNPYFSYLPMKPVKGETLIIEAPTLNLNTIVNKGIFILPLGEHRYKIGATYNWTDLNDIPSAEGIAQLENKLNAIVQVPYRIIKKEAGVRPSVSDRRPIIGLHPKYPEIGIFNGFGTKGVMLCPYLSEIFFKFMYSNLEIPQEINVSRFHLK